MIALLPHLPAEPKQAVAAKAQPDSKPLSATPDGQIVATPDFAAWVAKALADLPTGVNLPKSAREKPDAKANSVDKPAQPSDVATAAAVASSIGFEQAPPLPVLPFPKLGVHLAPAGVPQPAPPITQTTRASRPPAMADEKAGIIASATSEERAQDTSRSANAKPSGSPHLASGSPHAIIKPPLPEVSPKTASSVSAEPAAKAELKTDGMAAAQDEERMKFVSEQNKIAGQASQKLPPATPVSSAAAVKSTASAAKVSLPVDFSARDNSAEQISLTSAKLPAASAPTAVAAVHATTSVDRVEQLVAREAVTFRNSGADQVAVSLKVDAHTQLYLQLSYRDGQTQAVLRCEKGDLPALSAHFGQLQESLARQNIQLHASADNSDFGRQPSGHPQRDFSETPDSPLKDESKSTASNKPKTKPSSQRGWESWA